MTNITHLLTKRMHRIQTGKGGGLSIIDCSTGQTRLCTTFKKGECKQDSLKAMHELQPAAAEVCS
jgi:hypothetical protein